MTPDELDAIKVSPDDLERARINAEEAYTSLVQALNNHASPQRIDELKRNYARLQRAYWNTKAKP